MVVLLVLSTFIVFLAIDYLTTKNVRVPKGTIYTTPGFEILGCLAQDGGEKIENDYEI